MIVQFLFLLATHWIADFVLQSHWMASNKSKRNDALLLHILTYTVVLAPAVALIFPHAATTRMYPFFVLLNVALHFVTDWCTSRWSSKLWAKQDWHNFFVVIGFDQLIHQVTLGITMLLFFGSGA